MPALTQSECWERVRGARHGVLATVHAERGVDAVPVVYAVVEDRVVIPVDTVKAKGGARLQRLVNLAADSRCVLLVERYEEDWSQLWWVRAHGRGAEVQMDSRSSLLAALAERYAQYRAEGSVVSVIELTVENITGWTA